MNLITNKKRVLKKWEVSLLFSVFFFVSSLYSQDSWVQVSNPQGVNGSFEVYGESYYRMTKKIVSSSDNWQKNNVIEMYLPNEKGEEELFVLTPIKVLSKTLQLKYPNIKTYTGFSSLRPEVRLRLTHTSKGISAWMHIENGPDFFIQPFKGQKNLHFAYLKMNRDSSNPLFCKTEAAVLKKQSWNTLSKNSVSNETITTFRIAIAGTGEYTTFWGDNDDSNGSNSEDALEAVVSTINRINFIFERDLNLRLELVSDAGLIYENPDTDPFTGNFDSELQTTLDSVLGDEAYDVGHLFDYGEPNGDAGCIGCVCVSGKKGQGYSTHPFKDIYGGPYRNDYFDLDYAGHEIGHQFGAYHTYSFETEGTGYNAEPGSGSTVMGYAGITGVDDLQQHGDSYFHYYSIKTILEYTSSLTCGTSEPIDLGAFTVSVGSDQWIPIGTPFELSIPQILEEEEASYTYCWEQLDSAEITSSNFGPTNVLGALARSLPPTTSSSRMIPKLNRVLNNQLLQENPGLNAAWETLPLVGRTMNWGLSVRKQTPTYFQLAQDALKITVVGEAGPFRIDTQNTPQTLKGGALEIIQWNTANTEQSPINADRVSVLLSLDGGATFPYVLAEDIPNSGQAVVRVPNEINTTTARIKIKPKNQIFFAINTSDFSIESRDLVLNFEVFSKENCDQNELRYDFSFDKAVGFNKPFSLQIQELPEGINVQFSKTSYSSNDASGYLLLRGLNNLSAGDYLFDVQATIGSDTELFSFELKQRSSNFEQDLLLTPEPLENGVSVSPLLKWESNPNAESNRLQVSTDSDFNTLVLDSLVSTNQLKLNDLEPLTNYYWRIQAQNNCGIAPFSAYSSFVTSPISCTTLAASNLPKNLVDATDNDDGATIATINITFDAPIQDLNVLVDLTHTWLEDLSLYLETPEGKRYLMSSSLGGSGDDYTQTYFDQEAIIAIEEGTPPFTGSFRPVQDLSSLYGMSSKGLWKLVVLDQYKEDTGSLRAFELQLCAEGILESNADGDSYSDSQDNCPEISNEDQADIDQNGIGDLCDLFSERNISLTKKDTSCPDKENGSLTINARADYLYQLEILGPNGYQKSTSFTVVGKTLNNLAPGLYSICVTSNSYPDFEYCFETEINAPEELNVQTLFNPNTSLIDLSLSGSESYNIMINDDVRTVSGKQSVQLPLTNKINRVIVSTDKACQGVYEEWVNLEQQATVFPNPVASDANVVLPKKAQANLHLVSGTGELLWNLMEVKEAGRTIELPMNSFPRGWYVLQIDYGTHLETIKILKE